MIEFMLLSILQIIMSYSLQSFFGLEGTNVNWGEPLVELQWASGEPGSYACGGLPGWTAPLDRIVELNTGFIIEFMLCLRFSLPYPIDCTFCPCGCSGEPACKLCLRGASWLVRNAGLRCQAQHEAHRWVQVCFGLSCSRDKFCFEPNRGGLARKLCMGKVFMTSQ